MAKTVWIVNFIVLGLASRDKRLILPMKLNKVEKNSLVPVND